MDAREVKIDGVTYEQFRDDSGDEIGCHRCDSDSAYTIEYDLEHDDEGMPIRLCPFCYTTGAVAILKYKFSAEAEQREQNKHMIQCFNVLLNAQVQSTASQPPDAGEGREGGR
jgi:hypothetical protein